ncbi:MAG: alanine racemase [Deltaproteobacteria bacterium]|nr:alanine racemase [Candidatus Anaeroferrophillacea bacterium]
MTLLDVRPTRARIDTAALRHNYRRLAVAAGDGVRLLPVVKADAYGHGAVLVARALAGAGVDFFAVATAGEAHELLDAGIDARMLVLGGVYGDECDAVAAAAGSLVPVVWEPAMVAALAAAARKQRTTLPVHLKIDTGMRRAGVPAEEALSLARTIAAEPGLKLEGVLSHLAVADSDDPAMIAFTRRQREHFSRLLTELAAAGLNPRYVHLGNSAGITDHPSCGNLARPGIMLYGCRPDNDRPLALDLTPVMAVVTGVVTVRELQSGDGISYGLTFTAARKTRVALLPVGYADGLRRVLSNRGAMLVRGRRAPIIGRVCMDWTMIDVTDIPGVAAGDEVVIIGRQGSEAITAEGLASLTDTIAYEILCGWSRRVPRVPVSSAV